MTRLSDYEQDHNENHGTQARKGCPWCRAEKAEQRIEELEQPPQFPVMLRKMWSGGEVQQWLNDYYGAATEGELASADN